MVWIQQTCVNLSMIVQACVVQSLHLFEESNTHLHHVILERKFALEESLADQWEE